MFALFSCNALPLFPGLSIYGRAKHNSTGDVNGYTVKLIVGGASGSSNGAMNNNAGAQERTLAECFDAIRIHFFGLLPLGRHSSILQWQSTHDWWKNYDPEFGEIYFNPCEYSHENAMKVYKKADWYFEQGEQFFRAQDSRSIGFFYKFYCVAMYAKRVMSGRTRGKEQILYVKEFVAKMKQIIIKYKDHDQIILFKFVHDQTYASLLLMVQRGSTFGLEFLEELVKSFEQNGHHEESCDMERLLLSACIKHPNSTKALTLLNERFKKAVADSASTELIEQYRLSLYTASKCELALTLLNKRLQKAIAEKVAPDLIEQYRSALKTRNTTSQSTISIDSMIAEIVDEFIRNEPNNESTEVEDQKEETAEEEKENIVKKKKEKEEEEEKKIATLCKS